MHTSKPIFTAQFHPEHKGGPTDTEVKDVGLLVVFTSISIYMLKCKKIESDTHSYMNPAFCVGTLLNSKSVLSILRV